MLRRNVTTAKRNIAKRVSSVANSLAPKETMNVAGVKIQLVICPQKEQLILASTTLLFIFSCAASVYTYLIVSPGLVSYEFEPVNCTVAKSYYNGSVPCHVTNIMHRGCTSQMNCLEIIVETSPNYGDYEYYRLRQNEYSFVTDVLSCSYHPKECTCDATIINHRVEYHKISYGTVGLTFPCFQSTKDPKQVALSKTIQTSQMIHAVIWPVLGVIFSLIGCSGFWYHNHNKLSRLYIYNSWSPN